VNTVFFATMAGAEIQIVLKIFTLLLFLLCNGIYAKTIIHLSVGE
jgi:hypothetical protein